MAFLNMDYEVILRDRSPSLDKINNSDNSSESNIDYNDSIYFETIDDQIEIETMKGLIKEFQISLTFWP